MLNLLRRGVIVVALIVSALGLASSASAESSTPNSVAVHQTTSAQPAMNTPPPQGTYGVYAYGTCSNGFGVNSYNYRRGVTLQVVTSLTFGGDTVWIQNDQIPYNWSTQRYWPGLGGDNLHTWYRLIVNRRPGAWVSVWIRWPAC